jgi:phage FluMu protein Com
MPTFSKPQFGKEYSGINCEHCGKLVVFEDDPKELPDPFQLRCYRCKHMGKYTKQSLLSVRVERKH